MKNSGVERSTSLPTHRAKAYRKGALFIKNDENNVSYALGSGDIYSTTEDLYLWDQALYGTQLLSQKSKALLFKPESKDFGYYGYGFRVRPYQRNLAESPLGTLMRHGGSMDGCSSNLHRYSDDRLTVIVLANIRKFPIRKLTFELKEIALGIPLGKHSRETVE